MRRFWLALALALSVAAGTLRPCTARADTNASDKATAEALFAEGKRLMDAKNYAQACARFADSQRLDPGVGTLLNLGVCYERNGQTASAWATYKEAARAAKDAGEAARERFARDHAAALEPKLAKLSVVVPPTSAVEGLNVTRDGEVVPAGSWGLALPVDPGSHVIAASAPKRKSVSLSVTLTAAGAQTVTVPPLESASGENASAAPAAAPPKGEQASSAGSSQRTWAIVAGAVGLAAMGTGVTLGLLGKHEYDQSQSGCKNGVCTQSARQDETSGQSLANVGTWVFVGGAVVAALGVTLYFTAPRGDARTPAAALQIAPTLGGAVVRGAW
ncbi:MAG TPA: hypothetical protein VF765_33435 [Polyangiaceae bacterium]